MIKLNSILFILFSFTIFSQPQMSYNSEVHFNLKSEKEPLENTEFQINKQFSYNLKHAFLGVFPWNKTLIPSFRFQTQLEKDNINTQDFEFQNTTRLSLLPNLKFTHQISFQNQYISSEFLETSIHMLYAKKNTISFEFEIKDLNIQFGTSSKIQRHRLNPQKSYDSYFFYHSPISFLTLSTVFSSSLTGMLIFEKYFQINTNPSFHKNFFHFEALLSYLRKNNFQIYVDYIHNSYLLQSYLKSSKDLFKVKTLWNLKQNLWFMSSLQYQISKSKSYDFLSAQSWSFQLGLKIQILGTSKNNYKNLSDLQLRN